MAGYAGKRGRAVELSIDSATQRNIKQQKEHFESKNIVSRVTPKNYESNILELFTIGACNNKKEAKTAKPFIHQVHFPVLYTPPPIPWESLGMKE